LKKIKSFIDVPV